MSSGIINFLETSKINFWKPLKDQRKNFKKKNSIKFSKIIQSKRRKIRQKIKRSDNQLHGNFTLILDIYFPLERLFFFKKQNISKFSEILGNNYNSLPQNFSQKNLIFLNFPWIFCYSGLTELLMADFAISSEKLRSLGTTKKYFPPKKISALY